MEAIIRPRGVAVAGNRNLRNLAIAVTATVAGNELVHVSGRKKRRIAVCEAVQKAGSALLFLTAHIRLLPGLCFGLIMKLIHAHLSEVALAETRGGAVTIDRNCRWSHLSSRCSRSHDEEAESQDSKQVGSIHS